MYQQLIANPVSYPLGCPPVMPERLNLIPGGEQIVAIVASEVATAAGELATTPPRIHCFNILADNYFNNQEYFAAIEFIVNLIMLECVNNNAQIPRGPVPLLINTVSAGLTMITSAMLIYNGAMFKQLDLQTSNAAITNEREYQAALAEINAVLNRQTNHYQRQQPQHHQQNYNQPRYAAQQPNNQSMRSYGYGGGNAGSIYSGAGRQAGQGMGCAVPSRTTYNHTNGTAAVPTVGRPVGGANQIQQSPAPAGNNITKGNKMLNSPQLHMFSGKFVDQTKDHISAENAINEVINESKATFSGERSSVHTVLQSTSCLHEAIADGRISQIETQGATSLHKAYHTTSILTNPIFTAVDVTEIMAPLMAAVTFTGVKLELLKLNKRINDKSLPEPVAKTAAVAARRYAAYLTGKINTFIKSSLGLVYVIESFEEDYDEIQLVLYRDHGEEYSDALTAFETPLLGVCGRDVSNTKLREIYGISEAVQFIEIPEVVSFTYLPVTTAELEYDNDQKSMAVTEDTAPIIYKLACSFSDLAARSDIVPTANYILTSDGDLYLVACSAVKKGVVNISPA